jgi:hypothetical protein
VLARVPILIDQGRSPAEIADEIGCTLGTLRVRCSQRRISLRRCAASSDNIGAAAGVVPCGQAQVVAPCKSNDRAYAEGGCKPVAPKSSVEARAAVKVFLPQVVANALRQRAALRGISGSNLAAELLVTIVRDGLHEAVLDED